MRYHVWLRLRGSNAWHIASVKADSPADAMREQLAKFAIAPETAYEIKWAEHPRGEEAE